MEMLNHHFCFLCDGIRITFYKGTQLLLRSLLVEHRVILHRLHEFIVAGNRCVVFQHVENEAFLNGLLHRVHVEWAMFYIVAILIRNTEGLQRFIFRSGCEGKVAGISQQLTAFHHCIDFILIIHLIFGGKAGKSQVHLGRVTSTLTGMGLVNNNCKTILLM